MNSSVAAISEEQAIQESATKGLAARSSTNRRADIQGLRAVAVLMVVVYHAGLPFPGGFIGVDVFFVISGFVITALLQREWAATGRIQLGNFYIRRFKRLTPALAVMIVVVSIVGFVIMPPFDTFQDALHAGLGAMFFTANIVIARTSGDYFAAPAQANPLLHTWSLSVEEQFYLVFPTLMAFGWFMARKSRRFKQAPIFFVAAIAVVSFALTIPNSVGYVLPRASWLLDFYSPLTRVWEFAVGALLALAGTRPAVIGQRHSLAAGLLGAGMLAASLWLITDSTPFPGLWTLLPVVGTLLLLVAGLGSNAVTQALSTNFMVRIGDLSYSIYLWHWPFIVFALMLWPNVPGISLYAVILAFVVAVISYTWVEQPIRDLPSVSNLRMVPVISATLLVPAGIVGVLLLLPRLALLPPQVQVTAATLSEQHAAQKRGCHTTGGPYTPESVANCGWNLTATGAPIYLVGDSNANHFTEAVVGAGEYLGRPVWVFTASSCPLISGVTLFKDSRIVAGCEDYVSYTLNWLENMPPGIVFVAAVDLYWSESKYTVESSDSTMSTNADQKSAMLAQGLTASISALKSAGHQVVLIQSVPTYKDSVPLWDPRLCSVPLILNRECYREVQIGHIDDLQRLSRNTIDKVAEATDSLVLDLRDWFCDAGVCSTDTPSAWQYRDATHITVAASKALAPRFVAAVENSVLTQRVD